MTSSAVFMTDDNRDLAYRLARIEVQRATLAYDEAEPGSADEIVARISLDNARELVDSLSTAQDSARAEDAEWLPLVVRFTESGSDLSATAHTVACGLYDAAKHADSDGYHATARRYRMMADAVACDDDSCVCHR